MQVQCPTCGAEQRVVNPAAVSVQCPYCDAIMMLVDQDWTPTGKKSRLSQGFSRLYCGALCTIESQEYRIVGRVRYSYGKGFWDEWYALTDTGQGTWITEDDHEFSVQSEISHTELSRDISLFPLEMKWRLEIRPIVYFRDRRGGLLRIEGELPKEILPNERYRYADGGSLDGTSALGIEYDDTPPTIFVGRWIHAKDIQVVE